MDKKDEFINNMMKLRNSKQLEETLDNSDCEFYGCVFNVLYEITGERFTFDEILNIYDFFTDVLDGKYPKIDLFEIDNAFMGFYRLSKRHSLTKNLTENERLLLCFGIYQSKCVMIVDEKNGKFNFNRKLFENGPIALKEEYEYEKSLYPEKFNVMVLSDPFKEDYGYSANNPIEVTSVSNEYLYLNGLSYNNKSITFEFIGTLSGKNDIFIDSFDIYVNQLSCRKKLCTLYMTSDGLYDSITPPKNFDFF